MNDTIEININIGTNNVDNIRVILNHQEYRLIPVENSTEAADSDIPTLKVFAHQLIQRLKQEGRLRTSETYRCSLNRFLEYWAQDDIPLNRINAPLIEDYELYLKKKGLISNSTSFYMRVLRTIYNKAVAAKYIPDQSPFSNVYTGIGKTAKRAISLDAIQRISQLTQLSRYEELARDLFLFSFYTRGMSFIDMAYLTPQNIQNGTLTYLRHKTSQRLTMRWEPQMQEIVDRHPAQNENFLLPIIKRCNGHERCQYREAQRMINVVLKTIAQKAGISIPLTMYVARHSWASIARSLNVPVNIISEGMGHYSEQTTQIYLKSLNNKDLDDANANIIQAVSHLSY